MVQGIEDYSLWNISSRIDLRRGQTSALYIRFPVFFSLGDASCFHVFHGKGRLSLSAPGKKIMFLGKNTIFPDNTRKIMGLKKTSYIRVFFKKDHLSFSV